MSAEQRRLTPLNVNLIPEAARALARVCEATGDNKTHAVNQALLAWAHRLVPEPGVPPPRHARRDRTVRG